MTNDISVDWAELITLDLSEYEKPGGKERLAEQLKYAAANVGFFYVKNFDISQEEVDRQFALVSEHCRLKPQYDHLSSDR